MFTQKRNWEVKLTVCYNNHKWEKCIKVRRSQESLNLIRLQNNYVIHLLINQINWMYYLQKLNNRNLHFVLKLTLIGWTTAMNRNLKQYSRRILEIFLILNSMLKKTKLNYVIYLLNVLVQNVPAINVSVNISRNNWSMHMEC